MWMQSPEKRTTGIRLVPKNTNLDIYIGHARIINIDRISVIIMVVHPVQHIITPNTSVRERHPRFENGNLEQLPCSD